MALKKRPKDANQLAKLIVDIATGEVEDIEPVKDKKAKTGKSKTKSSKKKKG